MLKRYFQYPSTWMAIFTFLVFGLLGYFAISFGMLFVKDFAANLFATYIGVIVGLPAAMYLSHYQETQTEKQKKEKILDLLGQESYQNLTELLDWSEGEQRPFDTGLLHIKLKTETWKAFSDGGELQWINDFEILDDLSNCYYSIRTVQTLSRSYFEKEVDERKSSPSAKLILHELRKSFKYALLFTYNVHQWTSGKDDQLKHRIENAIKILSLNT